MDTPDSGHTGQWTHRTVDRRLTSRPVPDSQENVTNTPVQGQTRPVPTDPSTDFSWPRLPPAAGPPRQESQISSAGATRTRALTSGNPTLYQLSHGTDKRGKCGNAALRGSTMNFHHAELTSFTKPTTK